MPWDLRPVEAGFFEDAPQRFVCTEVVRHPPERVFTAIATDPAGWGDWYSGFDHSGRWTTPAPHGPGSHRTVRMARVTYEETILEWEPGRRFGFRVDRASVPLARAFAESYRTSPHDAGSIVQWVIAVDPGPALKPFMRLAPRVFTGLFARAMTGLEATLSRAG
jgi:hypothetical protein